MSLEFVFRLIGMVLFAILGMQLGTSLAGGWRDIPVQVSLILAGAALGLLLAPWFTTRPYGWFRRKIHQVPAAELIAGVIGLAIGLIIAALMVPALSKLPDPFNQILPFACSLLFGGSGMMVMVLRRQDFYNLLAGRMFKDSAGEGGSSHPIDRGVALLDTSVIIDGRIADISQTGFIRDRMLIPRFVLNELQHIADSPDPLRRNRGRRGLDMLNRLQKESLAPIQITDMDVESVREVDEKLVLLSKKLHCPIITNDFNLNRVAEIQGVMVLNINELANAVKAVLLPGEELQVRIIQEGKESGQGVGYLDDGTMVVVENGRKYLDKDLPVLVTKVLQTAAGRMIFAQPENK